jgi:hypothetical protein
MGRLNLCEPAMVSERLLADFVRTLPQIPRGIRTPRCILELNGDGLWMDAQATIVEAAF